RRHLGAARRAHHGGHGPVRAAAVPGGTATVTTDAAPLTAAELVLQRADDDRVGLTFEGAEWSWRAVVAEAGRRAGLLEARRRGGPFHVGVLLDNLPEYLFVLAGAARAGAVVVGLN